MGTVSGGQIDARSVGGTPHVFAVLDGFRGLAALCVMLFHYGDFLAPRVMGSSYLAVDLFFVLSGTVIAYAYDGRLRQGMSPMTFLRLRLVRLYPLYLAGSAAGLAFVAVRNVADPAKFSAWGGVVTAVLRTAVFLPDLHDHGTLEGLFPFDQPAWSLSLEMGANVLYAVLFRFLTLRILAGIVGCSAAALILTVPSFGTIDLGATAPSLYGGMERCLFGFFAGVLLFRMRGRTVRLPRQAAAWMLAVVLLWFAVPTDGTARIVHDLVCTLLVIPLLVWLGAWADYVPARRLIVWSASISYPVYLFHMPVVWTLEWLTLHVLHRSAAELRPFSGLAYAAVIVGLAHLTVLYYEAPLLRLLRRRSNSRGGAPLIGKVGEP